MKKNLIIVLILLTGILFACENTPEEVDDNFQLLVSDTPNDIEEFEYLLVTIEKARFVKSDGTSVEKGINETVDLTYLLGSFVFNILETGLTAGEYSKVELYISEVDYPNSDGVEILVPSKLEMNTSFEITPEESVQFVFGINVALKGDTNTYYLLPVLWESGVVGKDILETKIIDN